MTTTLDVIQRTRRHVMGVRRDAMTTVASAEVDNDDTSIVVASASTAGIVANTVIEIGMEQIFVTSVSTNTLTVIRGYNGTTPGEHPVGAWVVANPSVTFIDMLDAVNAELNSLSSPENGLYRVAYTDLAVNSSTLGFDLDVADGFLDVLSVRQRRSAQKDWVALDRKAWELVRSADTDDFASGVGIYFPSGLPSQLPTRVLYKTAFGQLSDTNEDVVATTGLPATAVDILPMGAAIRLAEGREITRVIPQGVADTRRTADTPMGNALQAPSALRRSRAERISEEAARLRQQWGS